MSTDSYSDPREFGLGDLPVTEDHYSRHMMTYESLFSTSRVLWDTASISEFDARTRGWVTPSKNQGSCGSCWAYAAVGTIESRILKDGGPDVILSEQQQISCNANMEGCCGGSGSSLLFYYTNKPFTLGSAPYAESGTRCPTKRTKHCKELQGAPVNYLAAGYYTVQQTVDAMKTSLTLHGPSYFRYDVWDDFYTFWSNSAADGVYEQSSGANLGGHAVLLIGWSDVKGAWLLKNSWGPKSGPNQDGTFWMAYSGHKNDLGFQMFNITQLNPSN